MDDIEHEIDVICNLLQNNIEATAGILGLDESEIIDRVITELQARKELM